MYLTQIYPPPGVVQENEAIRYCFGARETLHINRSLAPEMIARIKYLWHRFCCTAGELEIVVHPEEAALVSAWLGERIPMTSGYYSIRANARGVNLAAISEKTLMEGISTLLQLICPIELEAGREQFYISGVEIEDKPSINLRSVHICIFPNSNIATIEKAIHLAGFLKFTHVVLEFWGMLELEACRELAWPNYAWSKAKTKTVIDLARSYGLEIIPMFNHVGHASGSRVKYGRHVVLNQNPRLAKLFEPDGWTWCTTNPQTKQLLSEVRAELMELCGPGEYFHLGADESYSFATCDVCRKHDPAELFAAWINELTDDLARVGRRPIIWHDQLIDKNDFTCVDRVCAKGQDNGTTAAIDLIDRRVVIAEWQYSYVSGENPTTPYFMRKGFDTLLSPWDNIANIRSLCNNARELGAYGVMLTTWDRLPAYIHAFLRAANITWMEEPPVLRRKLETETAAILRTLFDTAGNFDISGWHLNEVDQ